MPEGVPQERLFYIPNVVAPGPEASKAFGILCRAVSAIVASPDFKDRDTNRDLYVGFGEHGLTGREIRVLHMMGVTGVEGESQS